jgi:hypothetical protein
MKSTCSNHFGTGAFFTIVSHPDNKPYNMSLVVVGSMAFDAIETPFGKSDNLHCLER